MLHIMIIGEGMGPRLLEQQDEIEEHLYPGLKKGITKFSWGGHYRKRYNFLKEYDPEKTSIVLVPNQEDENGQTRMRLLRSAESFKYHQAAGEDVSDETIEEMKILGRELADYIRKDKTDRETYYIISEAWSILSVKHFEED